MLSKYDAVSTESATLRDALWDAAEEMRTIVAAAAFRAALAAIAADRRAPGPLRLAAESSARSLAK